MCLSRPYCKGVFLGVSFFSLDFSANPRLEKALSVWGSVEGLQDCEASRSPSDHPLSFV